MDLVFNKKRMFIVCLILTAALLASPVWGMTIVEEPYVEQVSGYVIYFPTLNHSDTAVGIQAPGGIIPVSPSSRIATAEDTAGKMLELAAAYRYTSDVAYRAVLERLWLALEGVEARYGFYPEFIGLDGTAYSVEDDGDVVLDAVFLSRAIVGEEELTPNVTITRAVEVQGYVEGKECEDCQDDDPRENSCPYNSYATGDEKERLVFLCTDGSSTLLEVEYSVPPARLRGGLAATDIDILHVYYDGQEVETGSGGIRGVRVELLPYAREDVLETIATEHLRDSWVARGFSALNVSEVQSSVRAKLGFQARMLLLGEDSPPWDVVRSGDESIAGEYLVLTEEYSLLRGAAYLPGLISSESTASYEFVTLEDLSFGNSTDMELAGSNAVYRHRTASPRFDEITVEYRPIREYRVHVAGSLDSLLVSKFGAEARVLGFVETKMLPSGEYNVTALGGKAVDGEELEGRVSLWKPMYHLSGDVVQYTTLDLAESERLYKEAVREQDPEKFYVASDNLQIHSPRGSARQAMLALLSLDHREAEKLADMLEGDPGVSGWQVMGVFEEFREWYAQETLSMARHAVLDSLQRDERSPELEEVLMYLSLEAERTGLSTSKELGDLYQGYTSYFSPQTKDYENLEKMARHIPEYRGVVEAIEDRDYASARSLVGALPEGMPREVFSQRIAEEEDMLSTLKDMIIEAVRSEDYALAAQLSSEHRKLAGELNASDQDVAIMGGVSEGVTKGGLTREAARSMLSNLEAFPEWRAKKPVSTPLEEDGQPGAISQGAAEDQKKSPFRYLLALVPIAVVVVGALKLKRRRESSGRR